jgi:hypothetical protein
MHVYCCDALKDYWSADLRAITLDTLICGDDFVWHKKPAGALATSRSKKSRFNFERVIRQCGRHFGNPRAREKRR